LQTRSLTTNLVFSLSANSPAPSHSPTRAHPGLATDPVAYLGAQDLPCAPVSPVIKFLIFPLASRRWTGLQGPLKQRHRQRQRYHGEDRQIDHVRNNRRQPRFLQQQTGESMHRKRKRIYLGNRLQPRRECLYRINRSARKKTAAYSEFQTSRAAPADPRFAPSTGTSSN